VWPASAGAVTRRSHRRQQTRRAWFASMRSIPLDSASRFQTEPWVQPSSRLTAAIDLNAIVPPSRIPTFNPQIQIRDMALVETNRRLMGQPGFRRSGKLGTTGRVAAAGVS
jgi:hypothetical protein